MEKLLYEIPSSTTSPRSSFDVFGPDNPRDDGESDDDPHREVRDLLYCRRSGGTKTVISNYTLLPIETVTRCLQDLIDAGEVEETECVFPSRVHKTHKYLGYRLTESCRNGIARAIEEREARRAIEAGEKENKRR